MISPQKLSMLLGQKMRGQDGLSAMNAALILTPKQAGQR
jgi:hypothetical protein